MDDWCSIAGFFQETISRLSPVHVTAAGSLKALQSMRGCKETTGNEDPHFNTMTPLYIAVVPRVSNSEALLLLKTQDPFKIDTYQSNATQVRMFTNLAEPRTHLTCLNKE